jgi:hypothetical protein
MPKPIPHRPARIAAALLVLSLAFALGGCGGKSASPGVANLGTSTSSTPTTTQGSGGIAPTADGGAPSGGGATLRMKGGPGLAQFASCMRSHGEPNFPDPNAQGVLSISSSSGIDPSTPQFQSAQRACSKYLPNGGQPPSPAQQAKMQQQALRFSACMRAHGVPKFPDPQFGNGKIGIRIGPGTGIDPRSPQFQAAQKACQSELPGKAGLSTNGKAPEGGFGIAPASGGK